MKLPSISIAIPAYNEEKNIAKCLKSVFKQNYPKEKLEVFVVDDYSNDKTVEIAKRFSVKILYNGAHDGEVGKMIAFKKARGELFYYLDADCELRGSNWLKRMVKPLLEDETIVASFTRNYSKKGIPALERYYNLHPIQCDPIYEFFSPSIAETIVERQRNYQVCEYSLEKIPPAGRCLYRREILLPLVEDKKKFMELDFLVILVEHGYNRFAYVPQAGLYHHHVRNFADLIKKRLRNVRKVYLPEIEKRRYRWFDLSSPKDRLRIFIWIIYAHLIFPATIRGFCKAIKYREPAGLLEAIITPLITDVIIFGFLKDPKGRKLILDGLKKWKV